MHPIAKIAIGSACALAATGTALAQSPAPSDIREVVTVTGSRVPRALSDLPLSISIVDEEDVREQLGISTNILGVLDNTVPGLTVSQGEFRSGCRTNIRGRPAQFLINGVPTNDDLRRSSCSSLYGVNPFAIERIEVLRGSTALFGSGAPGGAINLITRQARSEALALDAAAQWSVNPHEASGSGEQTVYLGAGRKLGQHDFYVGGAFQDYGVRRNPDGGIVPGNEFRARSLNASIGAAVGPGSLRLTALYNHEDPTRVWATDFTAVSGERFADNVLVATPPNPFAHEARTEQRVLSLAYEVPGVLGHDLAVSIFNHDEKLIQRAADFFAGEVFYFDSDAENERLGVRTTARRAFRLGGGEAEATYGIDWLRQRYYRPQVDPAQGRAVIGYVSPEVILRSTAAFAQLQHRAGPWLLTAGVRHERYRGEVGATGFDPTIDRAATPGRTPDFDLTLGNAGVVFDLDPGTQLFAGFSQGAEVSEFGRAARGVADPRLVNLEGATSDQVEVGIRGRRHQVDYSLSVFRSESDKAANLQADPSCAGEPLCPLIPLRQAQELKGVELTLDWRIDRNWSAGALATWQKGEFTEPGARPIAFGTDTISPPRATVYGEYRAAAGWRGRLQASYFASTNEFDEALEAAGRRDSGSVFLMDVIAGMPLGPGRLSLGIANLLNRRYVSVTNQASGDFFYYLSEGRRATLTYEARF